MQLSPNIHVAWIDGRSVVLDLDRDRYIGLNSELSDALHRFCTGSINDLEPKSDGSRAVYKLLKHGIVTQKGGPRANQRSQAAPPQPTSSLWALLPDERTADEHVSLTNMISAIASLTQVAISLRARPFKSTIDWLRKEKIAKPSSHGRFSGRDLGRAQALVDAYDEIRPYFPLKPICRLDAPSLCLHLRRNGHDAQLIFGVRLEPFNAHCWVQIGQVAINEAWTNVRQYTPVLVV